MQRALLCWLLAQDSWLPTTEMIDELTQQYASLKTKVHDLREYL